MFSRPVPMINIHIFIQVKRNPISSLHAKTACISIAGDMEKLSKKRRSISSWSWLVSCKRRSSREIGDRLDEWTRGTNSCNRAYVMYVQEGLYNDSCDCIRNGLRCSDLFRLTTCANRPDEEEDIQVDLDEDFD